MALGKLSISKAASALGGWGSVGLGAAGDTELGAASVTPQAAWAPQPVHSADLPGAPACGFCVGF